MSPVLLLAAGAALASGGLIAIQAPTNALLARGAGSPINAALISFLVGCLALAVAAFAFGVRPSPPALRSLPWYAWLGGLYGAVFVAVSVFAVPRMGATFFLMAAIAGQLAMALMLDRMGAFGLPQVEIGPARVMGVLLVVAGAVLVRR